VAKKRYQVFVSSTHDDLKEERQTIMQVLLKLDCIPSGMELFPAANEDQWTLIKKAIDDCDYYLVIVGGRYGSPGPEGVGYTEMEYRYAVEQNKPVIGFVHKDPESLPLSRSERSATLRRKLEAFRKLVKTKPCLFWDSPDNLGSQVSVSLVALKESNPSIGWVKADTVANIETVLARASKNVSPKRGKPETLAHDDRIALMLFQFLVVAQAGGLPEGEGERIYQTVMQTYAHLGPECADMLLKDFKKIVAVGTINGGTEKSRIRPKRSRR
jgi:hypothetical protein